jgi:hypothetical protein
MLSVPRRCSNCFADREGAGVCPRCRTILESHRTDVELVARKLGVLLEQLPSDHQTQNPAPLLPQARVGVRVWRCLDCDSEWAGAGECPVCQTSREARRVDQQLEQELVVGRLLRLRERVHRANAFLALGLDEFPECHIRAGEARESLGAVCSGAHDAVAVDLDREPGAGGYLRTEAATWWAAYRERAAYRDAVVDRGEVGVERPGLPNASRADFITFDEQRGAIYLYDIQAYDMASAGRRNGRAQWKALERRLDFRDPADIRWVEVGLVPALARVVGLSDDTARAIHAAALTGEVFVRLST